MKPLLRAFVLLAVASGAFVPESQAQTNFTTAKTAMERGDYGAAFHIWLSLARAGDARAQVYLGTMYERCLGVLKNLDRATYWYKLAESQGNAPGKPTEYEVDCVGTVKKAPPIAQPMYLEAFVKMLFRKPAEAIKPLTYLVEADPHFSHFQNALAVALIVARPEQHEHAYQHAARALALDPTVPQFVVTYVLTDSAQWKIEADGTARISAFAAERLLAVRHQLRDMSRNAKKLAKLLDTIREDGVDPDFPFVFDDYKKLMKRPSLALARPPEEDFDIAQRKLVERIRALMRQHEEEDETAKHDHKKSLEEFLNEELSTRSHDL